LDKAYENPNPALWINLPTSSEKSANVAMADLGYSGPTPG